MNVSLYNGGNKGRPTFVENLAIEAAINSFKTLKYATLVDSIRNENSDSAKAWEQLPSFTFAASFKGGRTKTNMEQYNGVIQLNSGKLEPEQAIRLRDKAAQEPNTLAAFVTTEGTGVVILSVISSPDGSIPDSNEEISKFHAHAFSVVSLYYESCLYIDFKKNEHSLLQLTSATYDPELFFNPEAEVFLIATKKDFEKKTTKLLRNMEGEPVSFSHLPVGDQRDVEIKRAFDRAYSNALNVESFREDNRSEFVYGLAYFCCLAGIPEAETAKLALQRCTTEHFTPDDLRLTIRIKYKEYEDAVGADSGLTKVEKETRMLERFIKRNFMLRRNVILEGIEFRYADQSSHEWTELRDHHLNTIYIRAHKEGINCTLNDVKAMVDSEITPSHHPFKDYIFVPFTEWDGHDYIADVAATVPTKDPEYFEWCFRKWFVALVATLINDRVINHQILVLIGGKHGMGKSTWPERLLPPEWRKSHFDANVFSNNPNATRMKLSTGAILNIDELDTVQRYDQETVKELFTTFNINIRTSPDRPPRNFTRHASFFGTTNHLDILRDYTGSRRNLCHEVTGPINFDFKIDYKQLYAQAWNMIINGFRYYFNAEENDIVEQHNQHYMETDADMELFYEYYRKPEGEEEGIYLSAAKLADYIKKKTGIATSKKMIVKLGRNLKSLNYQWKRVKGKTVYNVVIKELD
ncbi:VapE domain-containing protein [uncultured Bacteroides sp.]|uniref:VapE domain-containing protein n=1 Tax=uncultured Bacteroides sp. TaxID=162156 RepID=UPI002AA8930F|nr:VapE domain-containing protein [uncultured Bacteroides sp.]